MNKLSKKDPVKLPASDVRESSLGWMVKVLATDLDQVMLDSLKPLGLSLGQFAILMTLLEGDGLTQSEIGSKISMPGYTTSRNLDELAKAGLLVRQPDQTSRRSFNICLTAKARKLGPQLFSIIKNVNSQVFSSLAKSETKQLETLMAKLIQERR